MNVFRPRHKAACSIGLLEQPMFTSVCKSYAHNHIPELHLYPAFIRSAHSFEFMLTCPRVCGSDGMQSPGCDSKLEARWAEQHRTFVIM